MKKLAALSLFMLAATVHSAASAGEVKNSKAGFLDFNFYPVLSDVDTDNVMTLNIFSALPNRFSYFSLNNFGNQAGEGEFGDVVSFYTEQNVRWQVADNSPLDLTVQYNMRSGDDNDRLRLGFRWRLNNTSFLESAFKKMNMAYSINFHMVQIDDKDADIWQMEHVLGMTFPYLSDRLYLAAFADHTFGEDLPDGMPSSPVVGEAQVGFRIIDNLYAVTEFRLNQYRRSDINNVAYGIEYKLKW